MILAGDAVLLIIDVQRAIDHPSWGVRNNPEMEANIAALLAAWRRSGRPIVHVRHVSREPDSTYRPGQPGVEFKLEAAPLPGETIITKHSNSAFIGTDLEARLRREGHQTLVIAGVITNNSVEATARMAGNLGFDTVVVADGTATFGRVDYNGKPRDADDVHALSLANLQDEYARIAGTAEILAALRSETPSRF
jgi:nicotinamidase-related amidase